MTIPRDTLPLMFAVQIARKPAPSVPGRRARFPACPQCRPTRSAGLTMAVDRLVDIITDGDPG